MKFLYLVFAVFLLVSLATPGYGQVRKHCPKPGFCSSKCGKADTWTFSADCKYYCCIPPPRWKGK
ncbi:cygnin-like [Cuculus canorus]|uniref:cygnin-like n=1 Tax=Cuculus canorus TaxID=55661 RepID=UPI0023AA5565|nr:cygnin-like [Cuculus canorus]